MYQRPTHPSHVSHRTGYDYGSGSFTGSNGLAVSSPCWPTPSTSGETMDKISAWLDKPTLESHPTIKNKHVAGVGAVLVLGGLAWYGHNHRWF